MWYTIPWEAAVEGACRSLATYDMQIFRQCLLSTLFNYLLTFPQSLSTFLECPDDLKVIVWSIDLLWFAPTIAMYSAWTSWLLRIYRSVKWSHGTWHQAWAIQSHVFCILSATTMFSIVLLSLLVAGALGCRKVGNCYGTVYTTSKFHYQIVYDNGAQHILNTDIRIYSQGETDQVRSTPRMRSDFPGGSRLRSDP